MEEGIGEDRGKRTSGGEKRQSIKASGENGLVTKKVEL